MDVTQPRPDSPIGLASGNPPSLGEQGPPSQGPVRPQRRQAGAFSHRGSILRAAGPRARGLPHDGPLIGVPSALTGPVPVRTPRRNRVVRARRALGPGVGESLIATVVVPIPAGGAPPTSLRQASEGVPPRASRREEAGRARGRSRGPEGRSEGAPRKRPTRYGLSTTSGAPG